MELLIELAVELAKKWAALTRIVNLPDRSIFEDANEDEAREGTQAPHG